MVIDRAYSDRAYPPRQIVDLPKFQLDVYHRTLQHSPKDYYAAIGVVDCLFPARMLAEPARTGAASSLPAVADAAKR
jgi:hypothetical protein